MNNANDDLAALKACGKAADAFSAGMTGNLELQKEYTMIKIPQYELSLRNWNDASGQHNQTNETRTEQKRQELINERKYTRKVWAFGGCTFFDGVKDCRQTFGDWTYDGWCGSDGAGTHVRCRRNAGAVLTDLQSWKSANIFPYPVPKPTAPPPPSYVPLDSVTCCPNVVQITGSDISETSIKQANECSTIINEMISGGVTPLAPGPLPVPIAPTPSVGGLTPGPTVGGITPLAPETTPRLMWLLIAIAIIIGVSIIIYVNLD